MPGRERDPHSPERDWTRISRFFREESRENDFFTIDDRTWADLDMDSVFSAVDRTCSSVGQSLLYDMMRTPLSSRQQFETREAKIRCFMENGAERT